MSSKKKNADPEEGLDGKTADIAQEEQETAPEEAAQEQPADAADSGGESPLIAELAAEKDKYLRLAAEYDNFRKRSAKERETMFMDMRADTVLIFLPVYDNLKRAIEQETSDEAYRKGIEMIMTQMMETLEKIGITEIPSVGETFDPSIHEAIMHTDDEEKGEGEIVEEFQKGFRLGDKVIRFALVKVAN